MKHGTCRCDYGSVEVTLAKKIVMAAVSVVARQAEAVGIN